VGGALALDAAWLFAVFLVLLVLAAAGIAVRRYLLERGGGTVECGLRKPGGPWRLGVASYQLDELSWFGVFGVSMRPEETFPRRDLNVVSRRMPTEAETASLGPGMIVLECRLGESGPFGEGGALGDGTAVSSPGRGGTVELALPESALTGLLSWLEAAPPGSHLGVALLARRFTPRPPSRRARPHAAACDVRRMASAAARAFLAADRSPSTSAVIVAPSVSSIH
jgi:hypothetical protein